MTDDGVARPPRLPYHSRSFRFFLKDADMRFNA